jgi:photosystem II stability/assembly factor-like uncharacterized protein
MTHRIARALLPLLIAGAAVLSTGASLTGASASTAAGGSTAGAAPGKWIAQASGTQQPLFSVSCFDAARCKAVGAGGTLLYTKDGGTTWRRQSNPLAGSSTILYRVACVGSSTCYVIGRPNLVLVTHNGGVTWTVHRIPLPGSSGQLTDSACVGNLSFDVRGRLALCRLGLLDLACIDARTCYVVATYSVRGQLGDVAPAVFLTTDGGATWVRQQIPITAPCQGDCGPPGVRVPYPLEWISCGPGLPCRAGGSVFIGSHEGYAFLVIEAMKVGAPWTPVKHAATSGSSPSPDSAVCPTITRCYGVWTTSPFDPGNEIWLSTSGGWMWQPISSGSPKLRNAIACPSAGNCYSVGNQGTITASTNGGPFLAQQSRTSHDLYGITCVDAITCFAVGNKGAIVARKKL